jgi:hypothetical protein
MLTAPITDDQYGLWRDLLLVLTNGFAILFWFLINYLFDDDFRPGQWPKALKLLLLLGLMTYLYELGVRAGSGALHELIHVLNLLLMLHTVILAVRGFSNDLLDARRRARIILVLVVSLYSMTLVFFEFGDGQVRNAAWFSFINASLLLLASTVAIFRLFTLTYAPLSKALLTTPNATSTTPHRLDRTQRHLKTALDSFVQQKRYQQNALTITALAHQLDCPEHRLRKLINQALGYRNFNSFLNNCEFRMHVNTLLMRPTTKHQY